MSDVFLSYSSLDRERVADLSSALEQSGISVWWDRRLVPGDGYETAIDEALTSAKVVMVIWTPASVASQWVRSEADFGRNKCNLIPVQFESCEIPRPFDRLHTADMRKWRGDKGNHHFPELVEAIKSRLEGRAAQPIKWRKRITLAAIGSATVATVGLVSGLTGIADAAMRYANGDNYAVSASEKWRPESGSPETQEGFRMVLKQLSTSLDLRTQQALKKLEDGSRADAIQALSMIAQDQSGALQQQMDEAATLWRQVGLLLYNDDPPRALQALDQARRFRPDDLSILTPLAALYFRTGRAREAEGIYEAINLDLLTPTDRGLALQVIGQGSLDRGLYQAAEVTFTQALEIAEQAGDDFLLSDLLIDTGRVAFERMEIERALDKLREAQNFADAIPYPRSALYSRLNQVEVLIAANRLDEATSLLSQTLKDAEQQVDTVASVMLKLSVARIYLRRGQAERAEEEVVATIKLARDNQLRDAELQAELILAEALLTLKRPEEAATLAADVESAWRAIGNESAAAIAESLSWAARVWLAPIGQRAEDCGRLADSATSAPSPYSRAESIRIRGLAECA